MSQNASILLVDDDQDIRLLIGTYLEQQQFDVTAVGDGMQATAMVETSLFDAIVLDVMMPRLDGVAFLKWLRGVRFIETPVIVHTGVVDSSYLRTLRDFGANHIIQKPAHPGTLIGLINDCLDVTTSTSEHESFAEAAIA